MDWSDTTDFYRVLANANGVNAYPLTAGRLRACCQSPASARRTLAMLDFFRWVLERGGNTAAELGYAPLPAVLTQQIKRYWAKTLGYRK